MDCPHLHIVERPNLTKPRLVLSFSGWMDGGEVSTGTVEYLSQELGARKLAHIDPSDFYIYNFPGSMEFSSLFRPLVSLEDGLLTHYEEPANVFHYDQLNQLIMFTGKEPNLKWHAYADAIFALAREFDVAEIYFIGSVGGLVPHTREPRIMCSVSDEKLKARLTEHNVRYTDYSGPGSITTQLLRQASRDNIDMINFVAEIPAYVQGRNPKCIEAVIKRLAKILGLSVKLDSLRAISDEMEKKLDKVVQEHAELSEHIHKLEEHYDKELFDTDLADLKHWLEKQGIRLD